MKLLITGAAGFIGYHLIKALLKEGFEVVGVDNINNYYDVNLKYGRLGEIGIHNGDKLNNWEKKKSSLFFNFSFVKMDIVEQAKLEELFSKEKFTHVVNLAAQAGVRYSIENPSSYIQSNLVGFANILEACRHHNIEHLLFASSSSVYGNSKEIPFKETEQVDSPVSLYAATKKSNELMAYTYSHLYEFQITGLRFFTVYGPWGRPDMAPILFANAISNGDPIKVFNNGNMLRDFTYVDDIIEGIINCLRYENAATPKYEIFNIGNSKPVELLNFINLLEDGMGTKAQKEFLPMQPGDVKVTYADVTSLSNKTGYQPRVSLKEGLQEFVKWYKAYYNV